MLKDQESNVLLCRSTACSTFNPLNINTHTHTTLFRDSKTLFCHVLTLTQFWLQFFFSNITVNKQLLNLENKKVWTSENWIIIYYTQKYKTVTIKNLKAPNMGCTDYYQKNSKINWYRTVIAYLYVYSNLTEHQQSTNQSICRNLKFHIMYFQ